MKNIVLFGICTLLFSACTGGSYAPANESRHDRSLRYEFECNKGNGKSCENLAWYYAGEGDSQKSHKYAKIACEKYGERKACLFLSREKETGERLAQLKKREEEERKKAKEKAKAEKRKLLTAEEYREVSRKCDNDDMDACVRLVTHYYAKNEIGSARKIQKKLCDKGTGDNQKLGCFALGLSYVDSSPCKKAYSYLKKSCELGTQNGCIYLAILKNDIASGRRRCR